jgi:hypothetical protein
MDKENVLDSSIERLNTKISRRDLLPWWMKTFCWIFMIFGVLSTFSLILGFTNYKPMLAFYGFESNEPFSLYGLIVIGVGIFKGITAYALRFEKDFAIKFGKIDAIIGIGLSGLSMLILPIFIDGLNMKIRFELILIAPFLLKLNKIEKKWESIGKCDLAKTPSIIE